MAEQEEPVSKLAKLENSVESMDEGQEEWLSEGVLTDDDMNPAAENDSSAVQSQDEAMELEPPMEAGDPEPSEHTEASKEDKEDKQNETELNTDKIEEALDNMENETKDKNEEELPGDLGTFLVRKADGTIVETRERRDDTDMESPRHTDEEDANDTDELLRMLGDDDQKAKKKKEVRKIADKKSKDDQSSDDEDVFSEKLTRLKAKQTSKAVSERPALRTRSMTPKTIPSILKKKTPSKTNSSSVVQDTAAKMKGPKRIATKAEPEVSDDDNISSKMKGPGKIATKAKPEASDDDNISSDDKHAMKNMFAAKKKVHFAAKSTGKSSLAAKNDAQAQREKDASKRLEILKKAQKVKPAAADEDIRDFQEDDADDMSEYRSELETGGRGAGKSRQPLMRPERMDEQFLSDADSPSDDNSYYDDLPSTDSEEELDDWFTFDLRAERAGDYLPLLGDRAHQVLSEERARLAARVSSLRFDLAAAAATARAHAVQLRRAAAAVAELDAAIKAA